jgi:hypothetical protein
MRLPVVIKARFAYDGTYFEKFAKGATRLTKRSGESPQSGLIVRK